MGSPCCLIISSFLLLLLLQRTACSMDGEKLIRAVGSNVTFQLQSLEKVESAAWSFHNEIIATVTIGSPPKVQFYDKGFKPRLTFSQNGTSMTIANLGLEDAGNYSVKGLEVKATFTLDVYRMLEAPTVSCVEQNCSAGSCLYLLSCSTSTSGSGSIHYSWSLGDSSWSKGAMVEVQDPNPSELLRCTAQNAVSNRSVAVPSPAALCTGNVSQGQSRLVAAVLSCALLLLALLLLVLFFRAKGWKFFHPSAAELRDTGAESEYATVYAQVGPSQQRAPKQKPSPEEETSKTIYSTIHALGQTDDEKMSTSKAKCQPKTTYSLDGQAEPPKYISTASMRLL